jgi:hypothetical protein
MYLDLLLKLDSLKGHVNDYMIVVTYSQNVLVMNAYFNVERGIIDDKFLIVDYKKRVKLGACFIVLCIKMRDCKRYRKTKMTQIFMNIF